VTRHRDYQHITFFVVYRILNEIKNNGTGTHEKCHRFMIRRKMTNQDSSSNNCSPRRHHGGMVAGIILLLVGTSSLLAVFYPAFDFDRYFLLLLGIAFLVWGCLQPVRGLIIPGGILTGLGAAVLVTSSFYTNFSNPVNGGIFLLVFACGWMLIPLFTALVARPAMWWPTIPAGFMAVFGVALLASSLDPQVLDYLNKGWPLILIVIGLYLILRHREMLQ
jgi:hypothetical protein